MARLGFSAGIIAGAMAMTVSHAWAADLFTVTVNDQTLGVKESAGFNSAIDAVNQFKSGALNSLIFNYSTTDVASGTLNYAGLTAYASFPTSGTTLTFSVPAAGISTSFTGTTRDDSEQMLVNYLKNNNAYGAIMRALAANSPVNPVAGNPSSLQSSMVAQGFESAFSTNPGASSTQASVQPGGKGASSSGMIGVGLEYGHFTNSSFSTDAYTIPLSYGFDVGKNNNYRVQIDLPITYIDTQGAASGAASLGIGVTVPVTEHWSLTPRISGGATGSVALASAAAMYAGSVTSAYHFDYAGYGFIIGDMIGYSHSIGVSLGSYSFDPNIGDVFTKNGAMVQIPLAKLGAEIPFLPGGDLQLFATDTYFTGTTLYENNIIEAGFSVGSSRLKAFGHDVRLGLSFLHGSGAGHSSDGVTGNLGFTF